MNGKQTNAPHCADRAGRAIDAIHFFCVRAFIAIRVFVCDEETRVTRLNLNHADVKGDTVLVGFLLARSLVGQKRSKANSHLLLSCFNPAYRAYYACEIMFIVFFLNLVCFIFLPTKTCSRMGGIETNKTC